MHLNSALISEEKEILLKSLNETAIVSMTDGEGNIIYVNDKFCQISQYDKHELIGQNHRLIKSDYHPISFFKGMWETLNKGFKWQGEICNKAKDGSYYWVYTTLVPYKDENNEINKIVSVRFDITQKKNYENQIKELANEKYKILFQSAIDGILLIESESKLIQNVNKAVIDLLGYSKEELLTMSVLELHQLNDLPQIQKHIEKLNEEGSIQFESVQKCKSGKLLDVEIRSNIILIDGKPHYQSFIRNISERKKNQALIKLNSNRLKKAQKIAKIGNWELDLLTDELHWSDEMYSIWEVKKSEFNATYQGFLDSIHPDDVEKVNEAYTNHIKDNLPYRIIHRLLLPNGSVKYVEEQCESDFDEKGNALISRGTTQDISERIKIEQKERKRISQELHDGIGQIIAAAGMALSALDDYAKDELNPDAYNIFETATKMVKKAIEETRMVSHNIMPHNVKEVEIVSMVNTLLSTYKVIYPNINFKVNSNFDNTKISDDIRSTIYRIFQEAISNSVKYSNANNVTIELVLLNKVLQIYISDDGRGFNVENIMSDSSRKGLGLNSIQERIRLVNGIVEINSKIGNGTTIFLELKL